MKLTKTTVRAIEPPPEGQAFYRDDELKGFGLRVTATGVKSFIVEKRIGRKVRRKTLGRVGTVTAEDARRDAIKFLGKVASGRDPITESKDAEAQTVTLREVFELYLKTRQLKPGTVHDYKRTMRETFSDWLDSPLANITKDKVAQRHKRRGAVSPARADNAMRVLQAVFNFARWQYEDSQGRSLFPENPVGRLSQTRGWYRVGRRRTVITAAQLPAWFEAVQALKTEGADPQAGAVADLLQLLLFTGLRRSEALNLTWADVDFVERTLTVRDTKNHEPLRLPLSDFLVTLLKGRQAVLDAEREEALKEDPETPALCFVFPGTGKHGRLVEPRPQMDKVTERSGVAFTLHDLRRTFITTAETLDISVYAIKRLVNHKMNDDVTAGYVVPNLERLRAPMQKITDFLLRTAGARPSASVVVLRHEAS